MSLFSAVDKGSELFVYGDGDDGAYHALDESKWHVEDDQAIPQRPDGGINGLIHPDNGFHRHKSCIYRIHHVIIAENTEQCHHGGSYNAAYDCAAEFRTYFVDDSGGNYKEYTQNEVGKLAHPTGCR